MPKTPGVISRPDQVIAYLRAHGPAKLAEIAAGTGLLMQQASVALGQAKNRGLAAPSCLGRHCVWSIAVPPARPVAVKQALRVVDRGRAGAACGGEAGTALVEGQIAGPREAPPFRPLDAASAQRAGAAFAASGQPLPGLGGLVSKGGTHVER